MLALPGLLLLVACIVLPVLSVLLSSLSDTDAPGDWSLVQYQDIFGRRYYLLAFLRTVGLGAGIAAVSLLLAIPLGYWMVRQPAWRVPLLVVLTAPMMVNVVARLYGWQLLLADSGPVNRLLGGSDPVFFVGSMLGVSIVMVHVMLPYAAIPLFNSMRDVDPAVLDAARTLGANPWRVFWSVVLPQSAPGIITGFILVFTLSAASFIVPAVMGGGRVNTFPTLVYQEMMALNFPRSAALAACLLVILLPLAWLSRHMNAPTA